MVPPDDPLGRVEHDEPVVQRLENVVVELPHAPQLLGLEVQLAVQATILDGGRNLAGYRGEEREIFAVEGFIGVFAAERQHRDCGSFEDARDEIVDALVAPELDLLGRVQRRHDGIVERHRVAAVETGHE
jgi:hypothetical protein